MIDLLHPTKTIAEAECYLARLRRHLAESRELASIRQAIGKVEPSLALMVLWRSGNIGRQDDVQACEGEVADMETLIEDVKNGV